MKTIFTLVLGFTFIIISCHPISKTTDKVQPVSNDNNEVSSMRIKDLTKKWERWYNEENVDSLMSLYISDAVIVTKGKPTVSGNDNIRTFYSIQFEQMDGTIKLTAESINTCKDMAVERGIWNMIQGSATDSGTYLTIWKLINGSWLTELDVSLLDE